MVTVSVPPTRLSGLFVAGCLRDGHVSLRGSVHLPRTRDDAGGHARWTETSLHPRRECENRLEQQLSERP